MGLGSVCVCMWVCVYMDQCACAGILYFKHVIVSPYAAVRDQWGEAGQAIPHVVIISSEILNQYLWFTVLSTDIHLHTFKLAEQK